MSDLKLFTSLSTRLLACALLSNSLFFGLNAQDKADIIANQAIAESTAKGELSKVEEALKQQRELEADSDKLSAETALKRGSYKEAIDYFTTAISKYKKVSSSEPRVVTKLNDCELQLSEIYKLHAEELIKEAEKNESVKMFEQAESLLDEALKFDKNLDQFVAKKRQDIIAKKQVADRIEKIGYSDLKKTKVALDKEKLWRKEQAQILYSNRRFLDAKEILGEVLILDPFDSYAARMIRRINDKLFQSGRSRRIATVQERIDQIEWKWSLPIQSSVLSSVTPTVEDERIPLVNEDDKINRKLKTIIPRFKQNAKIEDVLNALKEETVRQDPEKKGISIIYKPFTSADTSTPENDTSAANTQEDPFTDPFAEPSEAGPSVDKGTNSVSADKRYNFDFENVPTGEIIRYICIASGLKYKVDPYAVIVADPRVAIDDMVVRNYPVTSQVFSDLAETAELQDGAGLIGGIDDNSDSDEQNIKGYLSSMGVQFPAGSSVAYLRDISRLVVTNTPTEQRRVQDILDELRKVSQVIIESKFVEIGQTNLEEFGFQWSLQETAASNERINFIPNIEGDPLINDAGNIGDTTISAGDFDPIGATTASGLSSGIRSLTSLGNIQPVGGTLSFTSVLGANQFNTVIRALSMQDNTDILSSPKVITQNANTAVIKVVEERYFPESWDPPEVQTIGNANNATVNVQPSRPIFGEAQDVGVVLEVTPEIDADGRSIDIELKPRVIEFLGYDDSFNSEIVLIDTFSVTVAGVTTVFSTATTTESKYDMPILSNRSLETRVKVWDGETVVLGGLSQERVIAVDDKIPFLADMPLIGFLFRNKGERHEKRSLLIFVSARLVDNAGLPIRENNIRGLPDFKRL